MVHTTDEHPFLVMDGDTTRWVEAGQLKIGDTVLAADGTRGIVEAVEVVDEPQTMYNLTVALAHTFVVGENGWVVHNQQYTDAQIWGMIKPLLQSNRRIIDRRVWDQNQASRIFYNYFLNVENPAFPGSAYRNTTGLHPEFAKNFFGSERGTYHWDNIIFEYEYDGRTYQYLAGHFDVDNIHARYRHLQIHTWEEQKIRLMWGDELDNPLEDLLPPGCPRF